MIVLLVECALHSETVLFRYRSVFAVGRALDKIHYVEKHKQGIVFIGNSRTDNGIDPRTVAKNLPGGRASAFNLGLPGANAIVYHGEIRRLEVNGLLGGDAIHTVVLGLDENALWEENTLGYIGFLADRCSLWQAARYHDWFGSFLRLWSYSGNLRDVREVKEMSRFIKATFHRIEPIGGTAETYLGYRAGFGEPPNASEILRRRSIAPKSPSKDVEAFLWLSVDILQARGVRVFVTILPERHRLSGYFDPSSHAAPYREVRARLEQRGVIVLPPPRDYSDSEFINDGHLNDRGAQRYSLELGRQLGANGVR